MQGSSTARKEKVGVELVAAISYFNCNGVDLDFNS